MRVLGIDFGDKYIGLAVSDKLQITAHSLERYQKTNKKDDKKFFKSLVIRYEVNKIVVGIPLNMDGTEGLSAEKSREFAAWLEGFLPVPVVLWDERLTTKEAFRILREQRIKTRHKKKRKDPVSASIILSSYLESMRTDAHNP